MTAAASAIEAGALFIEPRARGLSDPISGAGVEVQRAADGRFVVAGGSRLHADATAAMVGEMRRVRGGAARVTR